MASELVSTEEVVNALLEYLVDPYLPLKASNLKEAPALSQQQSVAKQMHAVVLLYNYYQRKQNPQAQYLDFESFCKLVVTLKPVLVLFMNQSDPTGSKDMDNDLSVTEKAIQDACNISCTLDASKDVPSIKEWLIAKVSVLLLDSKKENCWLLFSSVTDGVWSPIERCLELPTAETEGTVERKHLNKKRRTNVRPVTVEQEDDDSGFRRLAILAVKDATGIRSDPVVLEKHMVYSLAKEKTASCFYIMQCTQVNQENLIPVKETLKSLQGPLVKRSSGSCFATEVVEHFHLLPYASIMSAFFSRSQSTEEKIENVEAKMPDESFEVLIGTKSDRINLEIAEAKDGDGPLETVSHSAVGQEAIAIDGPYRIRKSEEAGRDSSIKNTEIVDLTDDKLTGVNLKCLNDTSNKVHHENSKDYEDSTSKELYAIINRPSTPKEKAEELVKSTKSCEINDFNDSELAGACLEPLEVQMNDGYHFSSPPTRPQRMDIDACIPCSNNGNNSKDQLITEVYRHQKKRMRENGGETSCIKAQGIDEGKADKECGPYTISPNRNGISAADIAPVPYKHESMDIGDLQTVLSSKEKALSESSLMVLHRKKQKLYDQQRKIEDEIALCDRNIQRILDGGNNSLALKLETLVDFCNEMCLKDRASIQEEKAINLTKSSA